MRDFLTWLTWLVWGVGLLGGAALLVFTPPAAVETHAFTQSTALVIELDEDSYRGVLPRADVYESEDSVYKHIRGYARDTNGDQELVGFAFLTKDLGATNRGYIGPIPILVGMDPRGNITAVTILKHFEPYGYRSINLPGYRKQFEGKSIFDPFKVGEDIDAYSGATITTVAATKSIRHAARRMAREFLVKKTDSPEPDE